MGGIIKKKIDLFKDKKDPKSYLIMVHTSILSSIRKYILDNNLIPIVNDQPMDVHAIKKSDLSIIFLKSIGKKVDKDINNRMDVLFEMYINGESIFVKKSILENTEKPRDLNGKD